METGARYRADAQVARASLAQVGDFARDIVQRQSQRAYSRQQSRTHAGQLDAFRRALEQFGVHGLFQTAQALAKRGLTQAERRSGALQLSVLGDSGEILHVA